MTVSTSSTARIEPATNAKFWARIVTIGSVNRSMYFTDGL